MLRSLTECATDDLPDFLLKGFRDLKAATGRYPRVLLISNLLGEMMGKRPGVWRLEHAGIWRWCKYLDPSSHHDMDEFGQPA